MAERKLRFLVLVALLLMALHRCTTFPVFGLHAPSCLCDTCLEEFERGRR